MQSISFGALEKGKKPDYLEENDKHQCFYGDKLIILFTQIKETFVMLGFHLLRTAPTLVNKLTEISSLTFHRIIPTTIALVNVHSPISRIFANFFLIMLDHISVISFIYLAYIIIIQTL